jgi:hypothetical protein
MSPKTYKREAAVALFLALGGFFLAGIWVESAIQIAEFLTTPVFMFGAAAFGVDAYAKQILK